MNTMWFMYDCKNYKQGARFACPPAAPDSVIFHHISYLHYIHAIKIQSCEKADLASVKRSCGNGKRIKAVA